MSIKNDADNERLQINSKVFNSNVLRRHLPFCTYQDDYQSFLILIYNVTVWCFSKVEVMTV